MYRAGPVASSWRAALVLVLVATAALGCTKPPAEKKQHESHAPNRTLTFALASDKYGSVKVRVPDTPVATAPTDTPGVDFQLYALQRADTAVRVVFALRHSGPNYDRAAVTRQLDEDPAIASHSASEVALIDTRDRKEYKTFLENGADGACLCSVTWTAGGDSGGPTVGDRDFYIAVVAAPPADVTTVTVRGGVGDVANARIGG